VFNGTGDALVCRNKVCDMQRRTNGFTLIELLVVILIIALLISILLPVLRSARQQGLRTACLSNQKQIGIGLYAYAAGNDSYTPSWAEVYSNDTIRALWNDQNANPDLYYYTSDILWIAAPDFSIAPWHGKIKLGKLIPHYLESGMVFTCPSAIADDGSTPFANVSFNSGGLHWTGDYTEVGNPDTLVYSSYIARGGTARIDDFQLRGAAALVDRGALVYQTPSHEEGYNTLYFDGSASWVSDTEDEVRSTNIYSQSDPSLALLWDFFDK